MREDTGPRPAVPLLSGEEEASGRRSLVVPRRLCQHFTTQTKQTTHSAHYSFRFWDKDRNNVGEVVMQKFYFLFVFSVLASS